MPEQGGIQKKMTSRSIAAIMLGLVAVVLLPTGIGQLLRTLGMVTHVDPLPGLICRSVSVVLGSYLAARFAPSSPMQHALVLGAIWFVLAAAGEVVLVRMQFFGPPWYYHGLVISALPCAWLGGLLHRRFHQ
jgi:hypothetical protein